MRNAGTTSSGSRAPGPAVPTAGPPASPSSHSSASCGDGGTASTRRPRRAPADRPSVVSASHSARSVTGVGPAPANAGDRTVRGAAALRTSVSAIASHNPRISDSGERSRIGREPGTARACAAAGNAAASSASQARSAGSSGPARQASAPPAVTVGSSRPRATRPTPAIAAADHTLTDRRTGASGRLAVSGLTASSMGRASATGTRSAETSRLRIPYLPPAKTSSTLSGPEPVPQNANMPRRGITSGMNTASPSSTAPHDTGQAGRPRAGLA